MGRRLRLGITLLFVALLAGATAASAQPYERGWHERGQERARQERRAEERRHDERDSRRDQYVRPERPPAEGRLTADELRQLRRDVNSAGRDIYRREGGRRR